MQNKNKKLSFINQDVFVGLDVHKKTWAVTIRIGGTVAKKFVMDSDSKTLAAHLKTNYPGGNYYSVYEAGFSGYWIDRDLKELGINNIVVNPADVPTSNKEKVQKSDSIDSGKLARELSNNKLVGIYVPTEQAEALRVLNRLRIQLTKDQTRTKNRIKSLLNYLGIKFPDDSESKHWSNNFILQLHNIDFKYEETKEALESLLAHLREIRKNLVDILKKLRRSIKKDERSQKIVNLLISVPGIGFKTAVTLYTELIDINRFKTLDKLSCYVGLSPVVQSSGEKHWGQGISKRQNVNIRNMLIESSWRAVGVDPALTMSYGELTRRMQKQEAIIRIAKKLLSRIMHVWKQEEEYAVAVVS